MDRLWLYRVSNINRLFFKQIPHRPGICLKYFLSFPQKNLSPEKTESNLVFTFQFLNDEIDQNTNFAKLLSVKNWKVNTYFVSVFSGDRFFWGNERKCFTHIPCHVPISLKNGSDKSQPSPYVLPDLLLNYPFNFQFGTIWGYKSPYKVIKFVLRLKCSANQFHPPIFGACTYCTFNETIKLFKLFIFSLDWSTLFS